MEGLQYLDWRFEDHLLGRAVTKSFPVTREITPQEKARIALAADARRERWGRRTRTEDFDFDRPVQCSYPDAFDAVEHQLRVIGVHACSPELVAFAKRISTIRYETIAREYLPVNCRCGVIFNDGRI